MTLHPTPTAQTPAEQKLLAECAEPARIMFGEGSVPEHHSDDNFINANFLRDLLLSEAGLGAKGLRIRGAWISGKLDLQGARLNCDLSFTQCHFTDVLELVNARMRGLIFSGCNLPGLSADNVVLDGALFIRAGSHMSGEMSLSGAHIKGDVQLVDCSILSETQDAIFAPSMTVDGSLYLGNYPYSGEDTSLTCKGALFFLSLATKHDVFVTNVATSVQDDFGAGGIFQATEEHGRDIALSFARARIEGLLYFKDNQIGRGIVNLSGARCARLRDEPEGPGASYPIRLDGLTYDGFSQHTDTSVRNRLAWLERRPKDMGFTAQTYEQLARVLLLNGQRADARSVLMRKERMLRAANRRAIFARGGLPLRWLAHCIADGVMRVAVGYGYRPARALFFAAALVIGLGAFFDQAWRAGDMTPNAAPILISADWISATETHADNPAAFWSSSTEAGKDWETFNGYAYAADLVIPIVSLGQETAWAPSTSRSPLGRIGWWLRWFAKALGWIITALGAAAVTGAVRQD